MILEMANGVLPASLLPLTPLHPLLAAHYHQRDMRFDITVSCFILLSLHQRPLEPSKPCLSVQTLSALYNEVAYRWLIAEDTCWKILPERPQQKLRVGQKTWKMPKRQEEEEAEWTSRKEDILALYIEQDKPLSDVIHVMASQGFTRT